MSLLRRGGLGAAFGLIRKYVVPFIKRYIYPKAQRAVVRTLQTVKEEPLNADFFKKGSKELVNNFKKEIFDKVDLPSSKNSRKSTKRKKIQSSTKPHKSSRKIRTKTDIFNNGN